MTDEIRFLGNLQSVALKPSDRLVFTTPMHVSAEGARHIREEIAKVFPGHEIIILSDGLKFEVLEAAE
jgi:hypothetical protein